VGALVEDPAGFFVGMLVEDPAGFFVGALVARTGLVDGDNEVPVLLVQHPSTQCCKP
jgi:hypothetical protein